MALRDAAGRTRCYGWSSSGLLDKSIDANVNTTRWEYDLQGRMVRETRADDATWEYTYETTTSRLKQRKDAKNETANYEYFVDDKLKEINYPGASVPTATVSFSYDPSHNRIAAMTDGVGTTSYAYHPYAPAAPGAGSLASIDGPLPNDTVSYAYDETNRISSRGLAGALTTFVYDAAGRLTREGSALGDFTYAYEGASARLSSLTYPNGLSTNRTYLASTGDRGLSEIKHMSVGLDVLSKFNYTYDPVGSILQWRQQYSSGAPEHVEFGHDLVDQLTAATVRTTDPTPLVLRSHSYAYDKAGNRTAEALDSFVTAAAFNNRNQLLSLQPGGSLRFSGTVDEPATVTVEGQPATVDANNRFEG